VTSDTLQGEILTFRQLATALRRRWWIVLLTMVVLGAAAYLVALVQAPRYEAQAEIVYQPPNLQLYGAGLSQVAGSEAHNLQSDALVLKTIPFAERVRNSLGSSLSSKDLLAAVKVKTDPDLDLITIVVRSSNPNTAAEVANAFAQQFVTLRQEQVAELLNRARDLLKRRLDQLTPEQAASSYGLTLQQQYDDLGVLLGLGITDYRILQEASVPAWPVIPRPALYIELGVALGLLLGCGVALLVSYYDRRVKEEAVIGDILGVPVLALLPKISQGWARFGRRKISCAGFRKSCEVLFDPVRTLRSTLKLVGLGKNLGSLLVTSTLPGEGKSTVAIDLALAMALSGHRVLLVDADLRSPSVAQYLGLSNVRGMSDVLANRAGWVEVAQTVELRRLVPDSYRINENGREYRGHSTFLCITSGAVPPNPSELLEAADLGRILAEMRTVCDVVILDSPPLLVASDAILISGIVDAALLVTRLGVVSREQLDESKSLLGMARANLVGVVVVGSKTRSRYYSYYYHK